MEKVKKDNYFLTKVTMKGAKAKKFMKAVSGGPVPMKKPPVNGNVQEQFRLKAGESAATKNKSY